MVGLRIGEMERDSILSHGVSSFLQESMMKRSDEYSVQVNESTGLIDYTDDDLKKKKKKKNVEFKCLML